MPRQIDYEFRARARRRTARITHWRPPYSYAKNICCVGDDDQSIYGWRGAEVDNILRFEHDFPGAKVIRLERNYRSTGHILAAASHLIAHNEGRLGKTLRTEDVDGEKVTVTGSWDSEEEARAIGEEIEQLQRAGHKLNDIAILVRASFQMREFEDRFVTLGLPYRVIGGPRFYERAEIRDALAYLRVINSPADDLAFERIVNVPKRGLGDATVQMLHDHRPQAAHSAVRGSPRGRRNRRTEAEGARLAARALAAFERWRAQSEVTPHTELAEIVLDESGYTEMWQKDRSADAAGRLENLKELVRSMEEFENLQGFLEHISLVMDRDGGRRRRCGVADDPAFGQGTRIRQRVPAGLGGRLVSAASALWTNRAARGWRKSAASPMSALPAPAAAPRSTLPPTDAFTVPGRRPFRRAFWTNCRRPMSRSQNPRAARDGAALGATGPRVSTMWNRSAQAMRRLAGNARRLIAREARANERVRPEAASTKASRLSRPEATAASDPTSAAR